MAAAATDEKPAKKKKGPPPPAPIPGLGTPDGDTLREAIHAFDAGDHAAVRRITRDLIAKTEDAEIRKAAEALAEKIAVDPIQIVVLAACAAVLFTIVYVWVL
ncbi:MAG: hypothetical protein R3B82_08780 [Sandaracinaceae bacterium]